ncbi:MAG: hypothetical protein FJW40_24265 [Acidobacteria bacterium]|nr:hypothetical protein [Acidobacteriota bacterium]
MRWLKLVGLVLLVVVAGVTVAGWLLPREHKATRMVRLTGGEGASPERVFETVAAVQQPWRGDLERIEELPPVEGRRRWREHWKSGDAILMETVESRFPGRLVTRIADEDLPFGGTWTFEITAVAGGTEVRITEAGFVGNPVFRFISYFFIRDFHFGSPGPRQCTSTPHSRAGFDQNPLSEGGPVPADGFFRPSHKNEN